jgi:hypothetical protein
MYFGISCAENVSRVVVVGVRREAGGSCLKSKYECIEVYIDTNPGM